MRTNEERLAAMHRRAAELAREKRKKRSVLAGALSIAACLTLLIVLAVHIPGASAILSPGVSGTSMSGSIFSENGSLGYIVIAIIAFLLGISVTVFCFRLKKWRDRKDNGDDQ